MWQEQWPIKYFNEQVTIVGNWGSVLLGPPGRLCRLWLRHLPLKRRLPLVTLRISSWVELPVISRLHCHWLNTSREQQPKSLLGRVSGVCHIKPPGGCGQGTWGFCDDGAELNGWPSTSPHPAFLPDPSNVVSFTLISSSRERKLIHCGSISEISLLSFLNSQPVGHRCLGVGVGRASIYINLLSYKTSLVEYFISRYAFCCFYKWFDATAKNHIWMYFKARHNLLITVIMCFLDPWNWNYHN